MNWWLDIGLLAAGAVLIVLERSGAPLTLKLTFKGDVKRETAFLAQYGQSLCTPLAFILVWQLDPRGAPAAFALLGAVAITALIGMILKRLFGRVRPNREHAGQFLGPSLRNANHRESFPSSHSASAMALSTVLATYYPHAAITFWALAVGTAIIRYALEAHWPSDILVGMALGYAIARQALASFGLA